MALDTDIVELFSSVDMVSTKTRVVLNPQYRSVKKALEQGYIKEVDPTPHGADTIGKPFVEREYRFTYSGILSHQLHRFFSQFYDDSN